MKEIRAIIRPSKLPKLRDALRAMNGFPGMTVSRVEGFGHSHAAGAGGIRHALNDFVEKTRIEIVAPDDLAGPIVETIIAHARTGQSGDGLVWVTEVERAVFVNKTVG